MTETSTQESDSGERRFSTRRVLITGAASGIGRATAVRLAAEGASLVLVDLSAAVHEVAAELQPIGTAAAFVCDVRSEEAVERVISEARRDRPLWGVVTCAGITTSCLLHELSSADWRLIMDTNVTGTFLVLKHALPSLVHAECGSIVTIGSVSARTVAAGGGAAVYEASKAAVVQLTRAVAYEYANAGIRANSVLPGTVTTNLGVNARALAESAYTTDPATPRARPKKEIPLGRRGSAAEVANAVAYLLSDEASFVTGAALVVDGGYTLT